MNATGAIVNANPTLALPNQGLTPPEVAYVQQLATNGLLPFSTTPAGGGLPTVPVTATPLQFAQVQTAFQNGRAFQNGAEFDTPPIPVSNANPRPWSQTDVGTTPLYQNLPSTGITPALHNYFVQEGIQFAANTLNIPRTGDLYVQTLDRANAARGRNFVTNDFQRFQDYRIANAVEGYYSARKGNSSIKRFDDWGILPNFRPTPGGRTVLLGAPAGGMPIRADQPVSITDPVTRERNTISVPAGTP